MNDIWLNIEILLLIIGFVILGIMIGAYFTYKKPDNTITKWSEYLDENKDIVVSVDWRNKEIIPKPLQEMLDQYGVLNIKLNRYKHENKDGRYDKHITLITKWQSDLIPLIKEWIES